VTEFGVFEAIHTARAVRRFKPDPVPEALITEILDAAIRAPSAERPELGLSCRSRPGATSQAWRDLPKGV
jgi:nitroreductase